MESKEAVEVLSDVGLEFFKLKNGLIEIRYSDRDLIEHIYFLYNEVINDKIRELEKKEVL